MDSHSPTLLSLKEASALAPFKVYRDSNFATLGFITDALDTMLTFVDHPRFLRKISANPAITGVIVSADLALRIESGCGVAVSEDPRRTFWQLQNALADTDF